MYILGGVGHEMTGKIGSHWVIFTSTEKHFSISSSLKARGQSGLVMTGIGLIPVPLECALCGVVRQKVVIVQSFCGEIGQKTIQLVMISSG